MNAPGNDNDEDITPAEVTACVRVLGAMAPAHRRKVRRWVKVLSLALAHRPARRVRLAPVEPEEQPVEPEARDELARAEARRILASRGVHKGGAA